MALQPVNRRSVPEDVFDQILTDVLSGEMQPGQTLPSETPPRRSARGFPPAVREALSGFRPPAWSRSARATRPRCATSEGTPASTCSPGCCSARANSTSQSYAAFSRPGCTTDRKLPSLRLRAADRIWPPLLDEAVRNLEAETRPGRAATPRVDVLGPRRRRSRLHRLPADVQHASGHLRACATGSRRGDGRRGRSPRGLPRLAAAIAAGDPVAAERAAIDLLEPASVAMLAAITEFGGTS